MLELFPPKKKFNFDSLCSPAGRYANMSSETEAEPENKTMS